MELWNGILYKAIENQVAEKILSTLDVKEIVEMECYRALKRIREILDDESLSDTDCFQKIEEIVCLFESIGSDGGSRHDFG